jgi:hypothetical protein
MNTNWRRQKKADHKLKESKQINRMWRERLRKQMGMRWMSQNKKNEKKKCGREIVYEVGNK